MVVVLRGFLGLEPSFFAHHEKIDPQHECPARREPTERKNRSIFLEELLHPHFWQALTVRETTKTMATLEATHSSNSVEEEASSSSSEASPIQNVEVEENGAINMEDVPVFTPSSNLNVLSRYIHIVTTAGLPWRTGTAVNPLLRALELCKDRQPHRVRLYIPWVESVSARQTLYGDIVFENKEEQEAWIRNYCVERCGVSEETCKKLDIVFYLGSYQESMGSIFPVADICDLIDKEVADVCILEEPEHLNWFRVPKCELGWRKKFQHVVGILHTNYGDYIRQYGMATSLFTAPALNSLSSLVVKAYCHRIIRLSATLPAFDPSKEVTANVHGVRHEFLEPPQELQENDVDPNAAPVYFIGKLIWAKGFEHVLELQERYKRLSGEYFRMDVIGAGKDQKEIQKAFFGRASAMRTLSSVLSDSDDESKEKKEAAKSVFGTSSSLRDQICGSDKDTVEDVSEATFETPVLDVTTHSETSTNNDEKSEEEPEETIDEKKSDPDGGVPLEIIGDLSGKTISTGVNTAEAALKVVDSVMNVGFDAIFPSEKKSKSSLFHLAPAKTRFKWRRQPIPAKFLGVKDHIIVRDIPQHKIFLNMSTSEVLCTTSAEALAMGKFVILPKHRTCIS